jgi:hypothetical protein
MDMDLPPIPTRVLWDGRLFVIHHEGIRLEMPSLPCVPCLCPQAKHTTDRYRCRHIVRLDYAPTVRVQEIRESAGERRDMTSDEAAALYAWMTLLVSDVRAAAYRLAAGG